MHAPPPCSDGLFDVMSDQEAADLAAGVLGERGCSGERGEGGLGRGGGLVFATATESPPPLPLITCAHTHTQHAHTTRPPSLPTPSTPHHPRAEEGAQAAADALVARALALHTADNVTAVVMAFA